MIMNSRDLTFDFCNSVSFTKYLSKRFRPISGNYDKVRFRFALIFAAENRVC